MGKPDIPLIDIRPDHWEIVRDILHKHVPQYQAWAFGSRAKWTAKPYSDLDLAIIADARLSSSVMAALTDDFSESDLPWKVDVVDWAATSVAFQKIIEHDKVVVQKAALVEWKQKTIGDLVTLQRGIDLPEAERKVGSVPIMGSFGITGRHNRAACKGPGVTVGRSGASAGTVCYIEEDFWPLNTCLYVRDFKGNDPRFVYYFLKTFDLARLNSGSAQPSLNRNFVHPVPAAFPEPPEQIAIASILGALDDKIELNRQTNETLEAMARAIFKDWFVDFGPTRAKMAGAEPYLAPEIWNLFPDRLDDEGKPEGWQTSTVGSEFKLIMGQSPPGETYNQTGDGLPFFQGRTDFGTRYPKRRIFCSAPTRLAATNDTLVSVRAPVGDINMASEQCCIGRGIAAVRHLTGYRGFTYYSMSNLRSELTAFEHTGTVFGAINKVQFERLKVIAPTVKAVSAFEKLIVDIDERIGSNESETTTLAATRDLLLPKLMSGELRVQEVKTLTEHAMATAI